MRKNFNKLDNGPLWIIYFLLNSAIDWPIIALFNIKKWGRHEDWTAKVVVASTFPAILFWLILFLTATSQYHVQFVFQSIIGLTLLSFGWFVKRNQESEDLSDDVAVGFAEFVRAILGAISIGVWL